MLFLLEKAVVGTCLQTLISASYSMQN